MSEIEDVSHVDDATAPGAPGIAAIVEAIGLPAALEALLLVADEATPAAVLGDFLLVDEAEVSAALEQLAGEYAGSARGFELRCTHDGWRLYTAARCSDLIGRWAADGQRAKLTQAALETLAVIAYKQPVTRARIAAVRGVNVDGVVRTLMARGLIIEAGTDDASQAMLYRTTPLFLDRLGIDDISQLPPISPLLPDIDDAVELFDEMGAGA